MYYGRQKNIVDGSWQKLHRKSYITYKAATENHFRPQKVEESTLYFPSKVLHIFRRKYNFILGSQVTKYIQRRTRIILSIHLGRYGHQPMYPFLQSFRNSSYHQKQCPISFFTSIFIVPQNKPSHLMPLSNVSFYLQNKSCYIRPLN